MIRIRTIELHPVPGDVRANWNSMKSEIEQAKQDGIDLIVFPELALSGYLIGDIWDQNAFLRECEAYNEKLIQLSEGIAVIWGSPAIDWDQHNADGRPRKYNAAFAAYNGRLVAPAKSSHPYVIKTLLPNYRQFDDKRYFTSNLDLALERGLSAKDVIHPVDLSIHGKRLRVGLLICEDSWDENYSVHPMDILASQGADLFINISASPFTLGKNEKRHRLFKAALSKLHVPLLYVNRRGLENNGKDCYMYDGMTACYNGEGDLEYEAAPFTQDFSDFPWDESIRAWKNLPQRHAPSDMLLPSLQYGIREFLSMIHQDHVVIGVSGGIDSAVTAALFRSVLPADHILLVNTPTRFNSSLTKSMAKKLADNLGTPFVEIPIQSFIEQTVKALDGLSWSKPQPRTLHLTSFMKENVQARDRSGRVLSALSSEFGGIFTCNANKTELSAGYGTLYGDLAGAIAPIADLWKHQVYELGHKLNEYFKKEVIPHEIFTVKPSAELSSSQNIEKGEGDPFVYDYHDYLFRAFIEPWQRLTPEDLLSWYSEGTLEEHIGTPVSVKSIFPTNRAFVEDLERWWNLFAGFGVAKRIQSPPLLAISRRPYGYDLRESQMHPYYTDKYISLKNKLLKKDAH